ncbi:TIM barrel protein [Mycolicibacterium sp. P9-64]|uniref:sugar phosphate isomerase/epimerase family protein n=1 Tax=Mycolicibacterium sp. P9-64 TaxID=2024612 RepID=UPI001563D7E6|nr:TIM barrel protein [Mycolicibacterium sp. P9-64]
MSSPVPLGAFARIFHVQTAVQLAEAFQVLALTEVQLNLSTFGFPTIPTEVEISSGDLEGIGDDLAAAGLTLWGVSATFNTADPVTSRRTDQTARAADFIARLGCTGATAATLCSGSRDPDNMWGFHPDTTSKSAWKDFRASLDVLLPAAEQGGLLLAIEPEPANTVADVDRALRLQQELGDDAGQIGFILDPANLITNIAPSDHRYTLERAFGELGHRTICVHAKDTVPWSSTLVGRGVVDYELVARLHNDLANGVPLIIQDAKQEELAEVIALLRTSTERPMP